MKFGTNMIEVTQSTLGMKRLLGVNAAFKEWLNVLGSGVWWHSESGHLIGSDIIASYN